MGKAISYCYKCSTLLREDDFAKGKAVRVGDYVACSGCAPQLPAAPVPTPAPSRKGVASSRIPAQPRPGSSSAVVRPSVPPPNRKVLLIAGGVVALLVVAVILLMATGGRPPEPAAKAETAPEPAPKPAADTGDRRALEAARRWAAGHPQDLAGQIREFQGVVLDWERTTSAAEAQKEIASLKAEIRKLVDAGLAGLEREIKDPLDRKEYGTALRIVESALNRLPYPDWELARTKREHEVRDLMRNQPKPPPVAPEPKPPDPAPEPKASAAELKAWTPRWTQAMARATARDHAAAAAELLQAATSLKDEGLRAEAAEDIAVLKAVQTFLSSTLDGLQKRPVGWPLSVQLRDGRSASGRILQIGPDRVELTGEKESFFAEWSEVSAGSLAAVPRPDPAAPRLLAVFCLIEGEIDAAKSILGGDTASVGERFWIYAGEARSKIPKPEPAEVSARELFYAAEREFRTMAARGAAVEKYGRLKGEFAATSLVRRSLERIQKRSEAGRDYFLPASDFAHGGTFRLTREGRLETKAESDPSATLQNYAETEFCALPSTTYRAWLLAGGCCQETFSFLWQATDLRDTDPKTKQKVAVEPGGTRASPVKVSIKGLKPAHAEKDARRWEWIEIPLPRYAAPGAKKARFVTSQQGFAIAALLVSSTRTKPPSEAEVKDLEKAHAADHPPRPVDPDLIGHWTFDEGSGEEAQDASGNGHTGRLMGGPTRVAGQVGGALRFDGGSHVQLPNSPLLDKVQLDSYTLAAWYKPEVIPPGEPDSNDSGHAILIKRGWHEGLVYNREGKWVVEHWIVGEEGKATGGTWNNTYNPGRFHHLVGVVNRPDGKTQVYVDGRLLNTRDWTAGAETRDFKSEIWRIGIASPGAEKWAYPAKGVIDDVRMYKRALTADEVQTIYDLTR